MTAPMRVRLDSSRTPTVILRRLYDSQPRQWEGMVYQRPPGGQVVRLVDNRFGFPPREAVAKPTRRAEVEADGTVRQVWVIEWCAPWTPPPARHYHAADRCPSCDLPRGHVGPHGWI